MALTQLQADVFITLDAKLVRAVRGIVSVASIDKLVARGRQRRRLPRGGSEIVGGDRELVRLLSASGSARVVRG